MVGNVADRLKLHLLRDRPHLAQKHDLVGSGFDQSCDVSEAVLYCAVTVVGVAQSYSRVGQVNSDRLGTDRRLNHRGTIGHRVARFNPQRRVG